METITKGFGGPYQAPMAFTADELLHRQSRGIFLNNQEKQIALRYAQSLRLTKAMRKK